MRHRAAAVCGAIDNLVIAALPLALLPVYPSCFRHFRLPLNMCVSDDRELNTYLHNNSILVHFCLAVFLLVEGGLTLPIPS